MAAQKKKNCPEKYVLPSENAELESFSRKYKDDMMNHIIDSIEFAVKKKLPIVEVFQFKNSDFVITLSDKDYLTNLNNIFLYFMEHEVYEYCGRVIRLQKTLINKSKKQLDEKEKS
jgi:hypothetical protein